MTKTDKTNAERQRRYIKRLKEGQVTLGDWIHFDPDAYIEAGGKFLDIRLLDAASNEQVVATYVSSLPPEEALAIHKRFSRLAKFMLRVGKAVPPNAKIGKHLSEDQLRAIWRGTA